MGLDDFLIPQETLDSSGHWPLEQLDEVLATPPIGPDAPMGAEGSVIPDRPTAALIEPPPRGNETGPPVLQQTPELTAALVGPVLVDVPTGPRTTRPGLGPSTSSRVNATDSQADRSAASSVEVPGKLGKFLVLARDIISTSLSKDVERIESEFLPMSPLIQDDWGSDAAASSPTSDLAGRWSMVGPSRSTGRPNSSDGPPPIQAAAAGDPEGASNGSQQANDYDRIEGRLSLVTDRLERVAERFAAPPPIGSRPRPFRGRVDG